MGSAISDLGRTVSHSTPDWLRGAGAGAAAGSTLGPGGIIAGGVIGGLVGGDNIYSGLGEVGDFLRGDPGGLDQHGQYQFHDPAGHFGQAMDAAQGMQGFGQEQLAGMFGQQVTDPNLVDPNAFMNRFQADAAGMADVAFGHGSPLQQQLNALASQQAQQGLDMASHEMSGLGALHSGAAQRAMGQAMAQPFAQVQAQMGQQQLGMFQDFMGQSAQRQGQELQARLGQEALQAQRGSLEMQLAGQLWGQGAGMMGQLGQHASGLEAPIYMQRDPSGGFGNIFGGAMAGATAGAPFGGYGAGIGAGLGALSGILGA